MHTFIQEVAQQILERHHQHLNNLTVIFPNRRAGLFLRSALGRLIDKPIWLPEIVSLEDFILEQSGYEKLEMLEAVYRLHEIAKQYQSKEEPFDRFFFWGEMILRDFDEIDQYLVDPEHLFRSIKSQKELDEEFYFLDEEEMRIIRSFWSTFLPEASKTQQAFLKTWKILGPIYDQLKGYLKSEKKGYTGHIYREFIKEMKSEAFHFERKMLLAGFNALTFTEEEIIKLLVENHSAEVMWDVDNYYLEDENQEAGHFLRDYRRDSVLGPTFDEDVPNGITSEKDIQGVGVSLEVGQAKALAEHLDALARSEGFKPEETVIVLPNEYMLFPLLSSLPPSIEKLNITMGFPLKDTTVYSLIESLLQLQSSSRSNVVHGASFYHQPVMDILEHPLIHPLGRGKIEKTVDEIKKRNLIFLYRDELLQQPAIFALIFDKHHQPLDYLSEVLSLLHDAWKGKGHELELEFINRFYAHISQLKEMIGDGIQLSYDFLIRLFRRLARSLKVPFTGEPLEGLQIMGILETRNLDFRHVFILNMNEGSWPAPPKRGSFIPYNVRKAFELPVFEHQDSIYAYLFYRLLQRSESLYFYYNTVAEFNVNGEVSRYIQQLEVESDHQISHRFLANPIQVTPAPAIHVEKTPLVMERLRKFLVKEEGWFPRLTPSALDTYLYCRLRFYFKYVAELYEPDELQEELNPMVFGNILHDTMEILYKQFMAKQKRDVIQPHDFFWLEGGVDGALNRAFIKHYDVKNEKKFKLEGRNIIAAEIIRKMVKKILKFDQDYAPFRILGLETSTRDGFIVNFPVQVNGEELMVGLKGKIDRIDIKQGTVRVLDYKSGRDEKDFTDVPSLIDREEKNRRKAVFQVFFYSYLFQQTYKGTYDRLQPGLFNSRDLFDEDFSWQVIQKKGREAIAVEDFRGFEEEFLPVVNELLTEIYDSEVPFDQVDDHKKCRYCPYRSICSRD